MRFGASLTIDRSRWWFGLLAVVAVGVALRVWRLEHNGYGTDYYTAGVRSMMQSAHNFFFNAFDPAGFVSLDKPPIAFWIQVASAKLFGFSGLSVLLPQVPEGVAAIVLLFHLVQRRLGPPAGLLAALFLALTPLSVAVDRSSNTDSCLVLTLLLAAWALLKAAERASLPLLCLAMAIVGVGFNVKMMAALVVLPALGLAYLLAAPASWVRRLVHLTAASVVLVAVSLSWVVAFDLTPKDQRPFAGSTRGNSMVELAVLQYGVDRVAAREIRLAIASVVTPPGAQRARDAGQPPPVRSTLHAMRIPPGPLRLADPYLAAQIGWLLPLALFGVLGTLTLRRPRLSGGTMPPIADLLVWAGWAITCGIVFSTAEGIFHTYYLVTMAPPLCALAAIGMVHLWWRHRAGGAAALLLPIGLALTGVWQAYLQYEHVAPYLDALRQGHRTIADLLSAPDSAWVCALYLALIVGTALPVMVLVHAATRRRHSLRLSAVAVSVGLVALLANPAMWALSPVLGRVDVWFPAADIARLAPDRPAPPSLRGPRDPRRLIAFLHANQKGERYLLGTATTIQAAPIIIRTGAPVLAIGGYGGGDPILTPDALTRLVKEGKLRFVLVSTTTAPVLGRRNREAVRTLLAWLRRNGTLVDPKLWAANGAPPEPAAMGVRTRGERMGEMQLYDLRPTAGLVEAPRQ